MELMIKDLKDPDLWDKLVYSSSYGTIFHTWTWLENIKKYSNSKLYHIVGFKDDITVGIFPIFIIKKAFANLAFSPPPGLDLYLGPLLIAENLKQDKRESLFIEFQNKIDQFLFSDLKCKYVNIHCSPGLYDCRPFKWCGYQINPRYTSRIDLTKGIDNVYNQFDRKVRVGINKAIRENVIIEEAKGEELKNIIDSTINGNEGALKLKPIPNHINRLMELYKEFSPKDQIKIFIARYREEMVGVMISLLYKNIDKKRMIFWIGGLKELKGISQNDLLQWTAIKWAINNGFDYFENIGTGDSIRMRFSRSKFNPEPELWFTATKCSNNFYKILDLLFCSMKRNKEKILE